MANFNFTSNTASNLDDLNASLSMNPNIFGEEFTNESHEAISESGEGTTVDILTGNLTTNNDNNPSASLGALTANFNYEPSLPISDGKNLFVGLGDFASNDNFNPVHGQTQTQQGFQEGFSFNPSVGFASETNQVATNLPGVEEEDWLNMTSEEADEAFHRLMEMSLEDFEEMMRGFPDEATDLSLATPYAISNKRARRDEDDSAPITVGSASLAPQPALEPQQIHQIRQIREAKSRQGKVIKELRKRVRELEVDLAKSQAEVHNAFENGRMVTLLGLNGDLEAKEANIKANAEIENQKQVDAVRTFLEGQIAEGKGREEKLKREANFALTQQHGQLEEANCQIAEKNKKLDQFRAEAEAYKTNVEGEARTYKQATDEEMGAQKHALKALEAAKNRAESHLLEKTRALALAEKKVADLEKLGETNKRTGIACANQQKLFDESQSYAKDLEKRLARLEKEQSSEKAAWHRREEELQQSGSEACKALEDKIEDLEATAEKATRAKESSAQAIKGLNEELRRVNGDSDKVQLALKTKTSELEKMGSALEEQANTQNFQQLRETRSKFGPVEQINVEPSDLACAKMPSAARPFTFVAAKELSPPLIKSRQIHAKKSRRQLQPRPLHEPESQYDYKQEPEPKAAPPSQSGLFSCHFYPPAPASRPRRSHIHAEEAIRNRLHIPLGQVHTIVSKLDQLGDWQDGMAEKAGLIISAELTGLSIDDLKVMQSFRTSIPGSPRNPRKVMSSAQLEIPRTLVDLLATDDRPAIAAFLDGACFPKLQAPNNIARDIKSWGTQTEACDPKTKADRGNSPGQEEVAVVLPNLKQTRGWPESGFASLWKFIIFLCLLWLILPMLMPSFWSSLAAWLFKDPDPNSGWFDYVPEPSPWSNLLPELSDWPIISRFFDFFFDQPDLESKWCGNIPMG